MLDLQRRLLGRVYWRDCDLPRIAERFGVAERDVAKFVETRDTQPPAAAPVVVELAAGGLSDDEFRFTLSSQAVDTYGDTINQLGWDYRRFDKNPVALMSHNSWSLPIGQWSKRMIENGNLKASLRFSLANPASKTIERQVRERTLRMTSVGFMPGEWKWSEDPKRKYGIDFIEGHVLLEASVVSIGANPDALLDADAPGLGTNENGSEKAKPADSSAKSLSSSMARRRIAALTARF